MLAETRFQQVARRVRNIVGCGSVHLFLGCPDPELRHPLLDLFPASGYCSADCSNSPGYLALLQHERVRALCDGAVQTGQVQIINQFRMLVRSSDVIGGEVQSIAVAPLERPAGVLGFLLLTDHRSGAFYYGEHFLLKHYLPRVAQNLERDLRDMCIVPSQRKFTCEGGRTSQQARVDVQPSEPVSQKEQVAQQLKELDRLKNEFISMVSHELRTPLTAIKGYAVLLQAYGDHPNESDMGEISPTQQREYLELIMQQTSHLEVLISDLLDISRIHAGRLSLRCSAVDVVPVCLRIIQLVQQRADQQHPGRYKISYNLPPDLPLAWVDADRVQQVLTNLLENAVKYSPDGGLIEVMASACSTPLQSGNGFSLIESAASQDMAGTHMIYVTVRDRGIGIPPDQQIHLFQPFSRLEHSLSNDVPGAGLGLYITRKLVEAMGGSIGLSSSEGEGTSVMFALPVKPPASVPVTTDYVPMMTLTLR